MINNYKKIIDKFEEDIYNLSIELIKNVCYDLNKSNKADELIKKYLKQTNKKPGKKPGKKKVDGIKRPKSSYIYFLEEVRPKIVKKYPNDKLGDISKRVGKLWQTLNSNDRDKYDKLAKKDTERYKKELEQNGVIETDIEQSQTLYDLEESNAVIEEDLFSSDTTESSSGYDSSNSNNSNISNKSNISIKSNNSNKSSKLSSSEESNTDDSFSDIDTDDDDGTILDESSIQFSNKNKIGKLKKNKRK